MADSNNPTISVALILSEAPILSGSVRSCQDAQDETCQGGLAAVSAFARYHTEDTDIGRLVLPRLDYQSAFIQMHPLSWAVNRFVYKDRYNWEVYWAPPSLFALHKEDNAASSQDLTDLLTDEVEPLLSNVALPAYNSWSQYLRNIYFHEETGLAILLITNGDQSYTTPPAQTAMGLLRFIAKANERAGCIPSESTPFEVYTAARNVTSTTKRCWVPVLVNALYDPEWFPALIKTLTEYEYPPAIIVDTRGNSQKYTNVTKIKTTWIFSKTYEDEDFVLQRLFLSQDRTRVVNVSVVEEDMSTILEAVKDEQYISDIQFMRTLADEAATNDPVVGTSQEMPVVRDTPFTPCRAGECPAGNLFTDALRWKANATIAFLNSGGVRGPGWQQGTVSVSDIWNTLPFANTLCEATMSGLSLFRVFNFSTSIATFEGQYTQAGDRLLQVSGARITYNTQLNQSRLISIEVWDEAMEEFSAIERLKLYKIATSSWECVGFDQYPALLGSSLTMVGEEPAVISDVLLQNIVGEYLTHIDTPYETDTQGRLVNDTEALKAMDWIQTEENCTLRTYWEEAYLTCFDCPSTAEVQFLEDTLDIDGVSGLDDIVSLRATVINDENFTISLLPKKIPEWMMWSIEDSEERPTFLESNRSHTFQFLASASELDAGTAQATVSFAVQDGGSFPGCTSDDVSFEVFMKVAQQPEINKPESITIAGFVLMGLTCLLSIGLAIWVFVHRESRTVKARQPEFLIQLCGGTLVLALSILPLSIVDGLSAWSARNKACMALPWLAFLGFNFVMASLCSKLWRINKILNSGTLRRAAVSFRQAYRATGLVLTGTQLLILLVWTLVDPLEWEILHVPGEEWNRYGSCSDVGKGGAVLFGLSCALSSLSLLFTAYEAFKARNLGDEYSESRDLGFAVFTAGQIVIVTVPILVLISDTQPDAKYLLQILIIFAICISILVLIFGPLIWHFYNQETSLNSSAVDRPSRRVTGISASLRNLMDRQTHERAESDHVSARNPMTIRALSASERRPSTAKGEDVAEAASSPLPAIDEPSSSDTESLFQQQTLDQTSKMDSSQTSGVKENP